MTTVYLCEKPSQGRDIARVVGATRKGNGCQSTPSEDVVVTWCFGHLLEMAPPEAYDSTLKSWALDTLPIIPAQWRLVVKPDAKRQFTIIKNWLGRASRLVIATDADREGEVIAREVMALCGYRGPVQRLWLSALNDASIRKALSQLRDGVETQPLYLAGLARARADWLVGMNLTRAYTILGRNVGYPGVLPVGRVQSPTLWLVVDRDRAIEAFNPSPYWTITSTLSAQGAAAPAFRAHWQPPVDHCDSQGRCINETVARIVAQQCSITGAQAQVTDCTKERKTAPPPLPFDLNSLQQEAGKRFDLSGDQVLEAAQALYETHKITSYPRTECRHLPTSMHGEAPDVLRAVLAMAPELGSIQWSLDINRRTKAWNDTEVEKASHHGIIPMVESVDLSRLSTTERQVYGLIRRQYLVQFLPDHQYDATTLTLSIQGHPFLAKGKATVEPMRRQLDWLNTMVAYAKGQTLSALAATVKDTALPCQCGGSAAETTKSWRCTACGNTVWKTTFGKKLTVNQAAGLLAGKTVALKGLVSKKGKKFDAKATLTDGKVQLSFD